MNINQATDYGFRAVLYLAQTGHNVWTDAQTISDHEFIPIRFLLKIMPSLIRAGIIRSQRGIGGGYALARDPKNITLLDVVEAVEGPIYLNRCLEDEAYCSKRSAQVCQIHSVLAEIQDILENELDRRNFADLLDK